MRYWPLNRHMPCPETPLLRQESTFKVQNSIGHKSKPWEKQETMHRKPKGLGRSEWTYTYKIIHEADIHI